MAQFSSDSDTFFDFLASSNMIKPAGLIQPISLPSDQDASGRTLGDEEMLLLAQAIESGTLTSTKGAFVRRLETDFAARLGVRHAWACNSGTAAIHTAVAALDLEPGDEIVTTPITDMGALTPILYQGAIPVFADVDPVTLNVTAQTLAARITPRTRALVATHLFGDPCELASIRRLADAHGVRLIEDCAQAFLAEYDDRLVGTWGDIGCFSLQQGKHITTGEGGLVVTNDDELARRMFLFINKAWGYGDAQPDHYFLALNYRMNELSGAVAVAQLEKLDGVVEQRVRLAVELTEQLCDVPGIATPEIDARRKHTYWKYCLRVDPQVIAGGTMALAGRLKAQGISSAPRYIQKPAFRCQVIAEQRTLGTSRWPFTLAQPSAVDYRDELFPGTREGLSQVLVLPWTERYTSEHIAQLAEEISTAARELS